MAFVDRLDLMILMPLLAEKIDKLETELQALDARADELSESEENDVCELQETIHRYHLLLGNLKSDYKSAYNEQENIPSYEKLMERFTSTKI